MRRGRTGRIDSERCPRKEECSPCSARKDCRSNRCVRGKCVSTQVPASSCKKRKVCEACTVPWQCKNNLRCIAGICARDVPWFFKCVGKRKLGECKGCNLPTDCNHGSCIRNVCARSHGVLSRCNALRRFVHMVDLNGVGEDVDNETDSGDEVGEEEVGVRLEDENEDVEGESEVAEDEGIVGRSKKRDSEEGAEYVEDVTVEGASAVSWGESADEDGHADGEELEWDNEKFGVEDDAVDEEDENDEADFDLGEDDN